MKIVQSFWSRPVFAPFSAKNDDRSFGGWNSRKYYYMSWALSCLRLRQYYNDLDLYTDSAGKEILIDRMKLPYISVHTALDDLQDFDPYLWTVGKLLTYKLQREPFIHVDGDIFIWERFGKRIENARLLAQNIESNEDYYCETVSTLVDHFDIPSQWRDHLRHNNEMEITNTGIVGGHDLDFMSKYSTQALDIIYKNQDKTSTVKKGVYGVTVEQSLFHSLAREHNIDVEYYFRGKLEYDNNPSLFRFYQVPGKVKYIHPLATTKRSLAIQNAVEASLRHLYPDVYFRILKLCSDFEL